MSSLPPTDSELDHTSLKLTEVRLPSRHARPRASEPSERPQPATAVLVIDRDPAFCSDVAKLARLKGIGAAFAWGAENLDSLAFAGIGAVIVDADEWPLVKRTKQAKLMAFLARVPVVLVVEPGRDAELANDPSVRAVVNKTGGANAALLAAIEAPLTALATELPIAASASATSYSDN